MGCTPAAQYASTAVLLILSTSKPFASGGAGLLVVPIGVCPKRKITQSPLGASQVKTPSSENFEVRLIIVSFEITASFEILLVSGNK